jgi:uncharacterized protein (TIRG00374 family)
LQSSLADVSLLISSATVLPLVVALLAFVADFLLRAVRFWAMLQLVTNRKLPLAPTIAPFIASFGISDILPLRVGDGVRLLWFSRAFTIPIGTVIGAMLVERILDLVTLVLLGVLALGLLEGDAPDSLVWNFQLVLALAAVAGGGLLFAPVVLCRLLESVSSWRRFAPVRAAISALRNISAAVAQIGPWPRLFWLSVLSLLLWILEALVLIGAWVSLGGALEDVLKPFTAFVFSTLGTLAPSLPGHFGSFEYFGMQAFTLTGVDANMAAAVVLLAHLILWAPTAIFGICWLLLARSNKASGPAPER